MTAATTVLIFLLLTGAAWVTLNRWIYGDVLSVANVLFFAWVGPLILQTADLSRLETPWSTSTEIAVVLATLGMSVISFLPGVKHRFGKLQVAEDTVRDINDLRFLLPLLATWGVTFLAYVYAEFVTNPSGVPLLTLVRNPLEAYSDAHRWGKETSWSIITASLWLWTPLMYLGYRVHRNPKWRWLLLACAALYPVFAVLKLSRSDLFVSVFTMAIVHVATIGVIPSTRAAKRMVFLVAPLLGAVVVILLGLSLLRASAGTTETYNDFIGFKIEGRDPATLVSGQVYGYLALPYENLHRQMEQVPGGQGFGSGVFRPVLSLLGQGKLANQLEAEARLGIISPAAGSATFLSLVYGDVGYAGVIVVPLVYAALVTWVYVGLRKNGTLLRLGLWLNFCYPWAWLYFNNGFARLNMYLTPLYLVGLYAFYLLWKRSSERSLQGSITAAP